MRDRWVIFTAFVLLHLPLHAAEEVLLTRHTDVDGVHSVFVCSVDAIQRIPVWSGDPEQIPFSLPKAIRIAQEWIRNRHPEMDQFRIMEISLRRIWSADIPNRWYYLIEIEGVTPVGDSTARIPFMVVVLMDMTIIEPRKQSEAAPAEQDAAKGMG